MELADCRKLLDHGHVRLVESMGNDLSIVRNARVSYNAEWRPEMHAGEVAASLDGSRVVVQGKDERLIHYLWKNRHTSPFEAVQFTFDIKCPIFVARQWHRHRTWAYNEVSARYAELPAEFYVPEAEHITTQGTGNKQMRTNEMHPEAYDFRKCIRAMCETAFGMYKRLLEDGCPRELARGVLPMNTYTHYFGTVNLLNLFRFLTLRLHPHAQYEIRVYAKAMLELITPIVPVAVAAFQNSLE